MRRELLQHAEPYKAKKHKIAGRYLSEKLDGTRCFWDGGLSRGLPTESIPWASLIDPKTGDRKKKVKPKATGLWSRYGNPIIAPDEFLNQLPCCPLDGELWAGRGNFQLCRSICGGDEPDPRFMDNIVYAVYSCPPTSAVFATGEIKNANMVCAIDYIVIEEWIKKRLKKFAGDFTYLPPGANFRDELNFLATALENTDLSLCFLHQQNRMNADEEAAQKYVEAKLLEILERGGEGVVLRDGASPWTPKRHKGILKYKPFDDAEGIITGFTGGRETDKGSRNLGRIGALILNFNGKRLELSGMTDDEREFDNEAMKDWSAKHPGLDVPPDVGVKSRHFRVGQTVTFKYRELSDDGIPKEARYWRKRGVE